MSPWLPTRTRHVLVNWMLVAQQYVDGDGSVCLWSAGACRYSPLHVSAACSYCYSQSHHCWRICGDEKLLRGPSADRCLCCCGFAGERIKKLHLSLLVPVFVLWSAPVWVGRGICGSGCWSAQRHNILVASKASLATLAAPQKEFGCGKAQGRRPWQASATLTNDRTDYRQ